MTTLKECDVCARKAPCVTQCWPIAAGETWACCRCSHGEPCEDCAEETAKPVELARVVESGWVIRRKADGYIWSIGEMGNPDAREGGRPVFAVDPDLGNSSPEYWEMVHVTRTVILEETAPHAEGTDDPAEERHP